jgi:hypothetical protein
MRVQTVQPFLPNILSLKLPVSQKIWKKICPSSSTTQYRMTDGQVRAMQKSTQCISQQLRQGSPIWLKGFSLPENQLMRKHCLLELRW